MIRRELSFLFFMMFLLALSACHNESHNPEIYISTPATSVQTDYIPTLSTSEQPKSTPTQTIFEQPVVTPTPSIDISEISFCLAGLCDYIVFNKDGLETPDIKALFDNDYVVYENQVDKSRAYPNFYLDVAEYDLDDDGVAEYIVKFPNYKRSGGMYFDEGFLEIVYQNNDELIRLYTNNELLDVNYPIAVLSTVSNGFRDIAINYLSHYKPVYRFNGTTYVHSITPEEDRVIFDRVLSPLDENAELKGSTVLLRYNFRMSAPVDDKEYLFFIAGLFITAEQNGIINNNRLWACEENGEPKLFSVNGFDWKSVLFCAGCGDMDLSLDINNLVWPDEAVIVIYEPCENSTEDILKTPEVITFDIEQPDVNKVYLTYMESNAWAWLPHPEESRQELLNYNEDGRYKVIAYRILDFDGDGLLDLWLWAIDDESKGCSYTPSISGFYSIMDGKVERLLSGYFSGGSIGGDFITVKYNLETSEHVLVLYGVWGGFGGRAKTERYYSMQNGKLTELDSLWYVYYWATESREEEEKYEVNYEPVSEEVYNQIAAKYTTPVDDQYIFQ